MKIKTFVVYLITLAVLSSCATNQKLEIKKSFTGYLNSLESEQFENSVNYISEDYFELVSSEIVLSILKKTYSDTKISEKNIRDLKIISIGKPKHVNGIYYSQIIFSGINEIKRNDKIEGESNKEFLERRDKVKNGMQAAFGKGNVIYNPKTDFFEISLTQRAYAIKKDFEFNWKFLIHDKGQLEVIRQLIPNELLFDK